MPAKRLLWHAKGLHVEGLHAEDLHAEGLHAEVCMLRSCMLISLCLSVGSSCVPQAIHGCHGLV